jgi:hypothetical protein
MRHRRFIRRFPSLAAALLTMTLSPLLAQETPAPDDSFEVEPPLLVPPGDLSGEGNSAATKAPDPAELEKQLERAKRNAASAERLVQAGVLAQAEAEQRALRVVGLESDLAKAQLVAAEERVEFQKSRLAASQGSQADLDLATAALAGARSKAQSASEKYHKAQVDAATLNLHRQRRLLGLGSAHKSDVARAEEKLEKLQRGDETSQ